MTNHAHDKRIARCRRELGVLRAERPFVCIGRREVQAAARALNRAVRRNARYDIAERLDAMGDER